MPAKAPASIVAMLLVCNHLSKRPKRAKWSDARKYAIQEDIVQHSGVGMRYIVQCVRPQLPLRERKSGDIALDRQVLRGNKIHNAFILRVGRLQYLNSMRPHIYQILQS